MINYLRLIFLLSLTLSMTHANNIKKFNLNNGITLQIEEFAFHPDKHTIINCKDSNIPCLIDGLYPFGTAFNMPRTYVKRFTLIVSGKRYNLNTSGMYNAWRNRPLEYKDVVKYLEVHCYDENNCTLRGMFSDGAGIYVAEWLIINGVTLRTVISSSEDTVKLFFKNIEPPYYE